MTYIRQALMTYVSCSARDQDDLLQREKTSPIDFPAPLAICCVGTRSFVADCSVIAYRFDLFHLPLSFRVAVTL